MACNQCFCLACVRTNTVALVERCGKFQAIKGPGCQCLVWPVDSCVEINQCAGCTRQFFTKSFLGDGAAVLARSSGEEPTSPRRRAGVASMAWSTTR